MTAVRRTRARAVLVAFIIIATSAALLWGLYQGTQAVMEGRMSAGHLGQTVVYVIILAGAFCGAGRGLWRPAARRRSHRASDGAAAQPLDHRFTTKSGKTQRRTVRFSY
jgi:TRAP-type C4-dicarboxylate transport system permease small subunit